MFIPRPLLKIKYCGEVAWSASDHEDSDPLSGWQCVVCIPDFLFQTCMSKIKKIWEFRLYISLNW